MEIPTQNYFKAPEYNALSNSIWLSRKESNIDGKISKVTTVNAGYTPGARAITDGGFAEKGIITEPGSMLISQPGTTELLGRPAGEKPEEYIRGIDNVLVIGGNHYGWQKGAFLVEGGKLSLVKNDENELTGEYSTLAMGRDGVWSMQSVAIEHGKAVGDLSAIELGMNGAQIVRDGLAVPVAELIGDPRVDADLRNLVNFSNGNPVPGEFYQDIRGFSPVVSEDAPLNRAAFKRMLVGQKAVFRAKIPEGDEARVPYERLTTMAEDATGGALRVDEQRGAYRLGVLTPLPEQTMPLVGFGATESGELVVVAVDGRQPGSVGVSIRQLANLMVAAGVKDGILGCGGGDVSVVEKKDGVVTILNSPANVDGEGNRVTRRVPNVLVLPL